MFCTLLAAAFGLAAAAPQNDGRARTLPAGFQSFPGGQAGEVILYRADRAASAALLLSSAFDGLTGYFDARPRVTAAITGRDGQAAQAAFEADKAGEPLRGLAVAGVSADGAGIVALACGPRNRPLTPLMDLLARHLPGGRLPDLEWRAVPLPDGSGAMNLPAGWRILSADKGMVSAAGPQGIADLGIWAPVYTRFAAARMWAKPPLIADPTDPLSAARAVAAQLSAAGERVGQPPLRFVRLIAQAPAEWPGGKAAFLHTEWERGPVGGGVRWQALALIILGPLNADGSWMYYTSGVASPAESFAANLPVLMDIWNSWKVDDRVLHERRQHAVRSMDEAGRIMREAALNRACAASKAADAWDAYIRGTTVIVNPGTGERKEVPHYDVKQTLDRYNRTAPQGKWRELDPKELNRR